MPNLKENQLLLVEFERLKEQVNIIEQHYLLGIDESIKSKLNNNGVNDRHIEFTSVFEIINNTKLQLNSLRTKLKSLKKRINKNSESKKINSFKNFIFRFFTFGKINKNKNIKSEISRFNFYYQDIKNKCENIVEKLNDRTNQLLCNIAKRHYNLKIERDQLIQANQKLKALIENNKEKIEQLENNIQKNSSKISELEQENQKYMHFIDNKNDKFISQYTTLKNIIESQKQEIEFYIKQNKELELEIKLRDSGIESASGVVNSNIEDFNKDKINLQQKQACNKKNIKTRILQIN